MLRESKTDPPYLVATVTIKGKIDPTFIRLTKYFYTQK